MLTLIIGLFIVACGIYGIYITCNFVFVLLYVLGLCGVVITLLQPLAGWDSGECVKTYDLMPLLPNFDCYVIQDNHGNLMYKYKDENEEAVIRHSTLIDTCYDMGKINDKIVLKEMLLKPKKNLWCLPILCSKKTQYIIKLPKDKIEIAILK